MFVISYSKRQIKLIILIATLILLGVLLFCFTQRNIQTSKTNTPSYRAATLEDRTTFFSQLGIQIESEPVAIQEVILPKVLDKTFLKYNEIQKTQGFDIEPYAGKRVKRWSYRVLNYPNQKSNDEILANILVYDGKVIAGDICSTNLDGFMHGLKLPS